MRLTGMGRITRREEEYRLQFLYTSCKTNNTKQTCSKYNRKKEAIET